MDSVKLLSWNTDALAMLKSAKYLFHWVQLVRERCLHTLDETEELWKLCFFLGGVF